MHGNRDAHGVAAGVEVVFGVLLGRSGLVLHVPKVVLTLGVVEVPLDEVLLVLELKDEGKDDEEFLDDVLKEHDQRRVRTLRRDRDVDTF